MTRLGVISLHRFRLRTVKSIHDSVNLRLVCKSYNLDMNKACLFHNDIYRETWGSKDCGLEVGIHHLSVTTNPNNWWQYQYWSTPHEIITITSLHGVLVVRLDTYMFISMDYTDGTCRYRVKEHVIDKSKVYIEELTHDYKLVKTVQTSQTFISMSIFEWTKFFLSLPYIAI